MEGLVFANLAATAAVLFILLFRKIFIEKVYPKVFVLLWMLVVLRLLLPFEFSSGISLYSFEEEKQTALPKTEIVFEEEKLPEKIPEKNENIIFEKNDVQKAGISKNEILFFVWLSGSLLTGCFFAAKHFYLVKKLLKNSALFEEVPEEFKDDNIRFYKNKTLCSPLSFGVFKPVIILPEDISEKHLTFVLLHEYTHIKDRDSVLKILALFALALNWFNPFVWFMVKMLDRDIERYCDERVLKKLGGKNALSYANTILDFAEKESLSLSFFSAASLCERVTSIMKNKNKKQSVFMVISVFAAAIFTMTACGTVPKEPEKEPVLNENSELLELIEKAGWQKTGSYDEFINIENGELGMAVITTSEAEENIQYYWNFNRLPVKRIVIKDLGFSENSGIIYCCDTGNNTTGEVIVRNYKTLLEKGFKIEYDEGDIVVSSEKPLSDLEHVFSIDFFVNMDNVEIVSETHEIKYLSVEAGVEYEPAIKTEDESSPGEIAEAIGYMSFKEITAEGYYPDWMQPYTKIVYDENGVPTITEGGELLPEDLVGRPEFTVGEPVPFTSVGIEDPFFMIQPNTMAEYDLHGFIQNIYYLWPDGNYNLSPPQETVVPEELIKVPEFLWPCEEKDLNAVVGSYNGHTGIDIGHTQGAEIYASRAGTVTETEWGNTGYGYYIVIDHGEGYSTLYAHCSEIFVKKGQKVKAGETIGLIGSTGNSTGTHLHFELRYKGGIIDPQNLLIKN